MRLSKPTLEQYFFFAGLLLALSPVWLSGRFFMTGDGPCHVYNARVFLDFVLEQHRGFYDPFYYLNTNFDPNWLSHLCLAILQLAFAPEVAEKLFLSGYVLLFGFGLRYLLRQINPNSLFLSAFGLLFTWYSLLQSGFYNYALSVALFFWVCGFWLRYRQDWSPGRLLILAGLWLALFSAHPMGLVFSIVFIGVGETVDLFRWVRQSGWLAAWQQQHKQIFSLCLAALPMLVLLFAYFIRKPWAPDGNSAVFSILTTDLRHFKVLITLDSTERDIVNTVGILTALLLCWAIWQRRRAFLFTDFILLFLALTIWQYYHQAGAQAVELLLPQRIQLFIYLGLLCWIATAQFPKFFKWLVPGLSLVIMLALLSVRIPILKKASALTDDYVSCVQQIDNESVVLVLNYDLNGLDSAGKLIANRNWLFMHAADYIGAYRTAILSDNYEATRAYFPIIWRGQRNMFVQTDKEGINFDNRPPRADILDFERRTEGYKIDYVLLLSYDQRFYHHQYAREIMSQLEHAYEFKTGSPMGKMELWKRKK